MSKATQDNIHNIADRLEASVRYGVITGGDDYERAIAEQQAVNAAKFIRELKAENARLREGWLPYPENKPSETGDYLVTTADGIVNIDE